MVTISSTDSLVSRYHKLLLRSWTPDLSDQVIELILSAAPDAPPDLKLLLREPESAKEGWSKIVSRIDATSRFIDWPDLPTIPSAALKAPLSVASPRSLRLSLALTLSAHFDVSGDVEFLADLQSLAFHAALDELPPKLLKRNIADYAILVRAATLFAQKYTAFDVSHAAYLLSMVHECLGNRERRLALLSACVTSTSPEDHSFLTKAQMFWSELIDAGRFRDAQRFVFDLHWWAPPRHREEVEEMIISAIQYMNRHKSQQTDRARPSVGRTGS